MLIDTIEASIDQIVSKYKRLVLERNWLREGDKISWNAYHPYVGKRAYIREYERLLENRQYSLLLRDGAFFQFYYEFSEGSLKRARLAYFPSPAGSLENYHEIIGYLDELGLDMDWTDEIFLEIYSNVDSLFVAGSLTHVRLDYDGTTTSHAKAHLQYGSLNELRVSSRYVFSPFVFFDFVARSLYTSEHEASASKKGYGACLRAQLADYNRFDAGEMRPSIYLNID